MIRVCVPGFSGWWSVGLVSWCMWRAISRIVCWIYGWTDVTRGSELGCLSLSLFRELWLDFWVFLVLQEFYETMSSLNRFSFKWHGFMLFWHPYDFNCRCLVVYSRPPSPLQDPTRSGNAFLWLLCWGTGWSMRWPTVKWWPSSCSASSPSMARFAPISATLLVSWVSDVCGFTTFLVNEVYVRILKLFSFLDYSAMIYFQKSYMNLTHANG